MRFINIMDIQGDEMIAKDIYTMNGQLLAKEGARLNPGLIGRIKQNNIMSLYVVDDIGLKVMEELGIDEFYLDDLIDPQMRISFNKNLQEKLKQFAGSRDTGKYSGSGAVLIEEVSRISESIVDELLDKKDLSVKLVDIKQLDVYDYGHSVNTAVLSVITGMIQGYNRNDLLILAQGALLMNIGNELFDNRILKKAGQLNRDEQTIMRSHTDLGRRILSDKSTISPYVKNIVYNHHERLDGSGYPRGIMGNEIDKYTKIVMIADVYDAMTSDRYYRKAYTQAEALEYIMGNTIMFDLEMAKVFSRNIILYPKGEYVRLSDGSFAMVIEQNRHIPLRPIVRVMKGKKTGETIDLRLETNITIVEVVQSLDIE